MHYFIVICAYLLEDETVLDYPALKLLFVIIPLHMQTIAGTEKYNKITNNWIQMKFISPIYDFTHKYLWLMVIPH